MKKVIVAGCRNFTDYLRLANEMTAILNGENVIIVEGEASGADINGKIYALNNGLFVEEHPALWNDLTLQPCVVKTNKFGRQYNVLAGHNRNKEMLQSVLANEDGGFLVAFWDGKSTGTKNMIDIAEQAGVEVRIVYI